MKIAIVYASKTGNTKELALFLRGLFLEANVIVGFFHINQFTLEHLPLFDAIIVLTYTWGNGEIPFEMRELYHAFEEQNVEQVVTGVAGTGDSGYARFCGAVDDFRDMLYVQTKLAAILRIEITPQRKDVMRCKIFVERVLAKLENTRHKSL